MEAEVEVMDRCKREAHPSIEGLEGRELLNGSRGHEAHARATQSASTSNNRLDYATLGGVKVHLQLSGPGSLAGSGVSGGILNLVYSGTTASSVVAGTVKGGSGAAPLGTITNANVPIGSTTGLGGEIIGAIRLPAFNLISGGVVNLLGGVNELDLNSVAANTQIRLRDTPLVTTSTATATTLTTANATSGSINNTAGGTSGVISAGASSGGNLNVRGAGTLEPVATGFGGNNVGAINGAIAMIPTVGNGQNFAGTPGLNQSAVSSGRNLTYSVDNLGGTRLTTIAGTFMPGPNLIEPRDVSKPGGPPPPPGVIVNVHHVAGGPTLGSPPLGDAQIFGYDPAAQALIRFDAVTGAQLQSIAVPASTSGGGGVALARSAGRLVALVGIGPEVVAFDAATGLPAGAFAVAGLSRSGIQSVSGLASSGESTVVVDATDGPDGTAQAIDVTRSLATGQAVAVGSSFSPGREFVLSGGIAGVPGNPNFYASGGAHFDTFSPNMTQAGILAINPAGGKLAEASRASLTSQGNFVTANPDGSIATNPSRALGSIDALLALDDGVKNGQNVISLLTPSGLSNSGTITLADANPLAGLSSSFHPEIANAALVNVQGNVQSFTARDATGLILNDAGNLNLVAIGRASNSSIVGLPFGHVEIPVRDNVSIVTSSRLVGTRGDVTINPSARQVGPLTLP